jgi:hypothetical protein
MYAPYTLHALSDMLSNHLSTPELYTHRFSALTMKSVGQAANAMVKEVARQWAEIPVSHVYTHTYKQTCIQGLSDSAGLDFHERQRIHTRIHTHIHTHKQGLSDSAGLDFHERQEWRASGKTLVKPDYQACIEIATKASLKEMIAPGMCACIEREWHTGIKLIAVGMCQYIERACQRDDMCAISMHQATFARYICTLIVHVYICTLFWSCLHSSINIAAWLICTMIHPDLCLDSCFCCTHICYLSIFVMSIFVVSMFVISTFVVSVLVASIFIISILLYIHICYIHIFVTSIFVIYIYLLHPYLLYPYLLYMYICYIHICYIIHISYIHICVIYVYLLYPQLLYIHVCCIHIGYTPIFVLLSKYTVHDSDAV